MHTPISAAANRPLLDMPATADVALCCATCLDTLTPNGACMNVGACETADRIATRRTFHGATVKSAPAAWTIRGNVD